MLSKVIIILSGYNQRAIISFIRVLNKNNIPFRIITIGSDDPINKTIYSQNIILERKSKELRINLFIEIANKLLKDNTFKKGVILPSSEFLNQFLIKNITALEKLNFEIPLVKENVYNTISNKYSFTAICRNNGVFVPREFSVFPKFPFVAKPKSSTSSTGHSLYPYIIENSQKLLFFRTNENIDDFFFQEFIGGNSIYLLFYFKKNGEVIKFSQENFIQQANGKSIIFSKSSKYHENKIVNNFIEIFNKLGYFGPLMVEVKLFKQNFYMIEANPRIWGPSQLFVDSNIPIFENYISDIGFRIEIPSKKSIDSMDYFWLGGMLPSFSQTKNDVVLHNYSWRKFAFDFPTLLLHDVYRRKDTENIFISEIGG